MEETKRRGEYGAGFGLSHIIGRERDSWWRESRRGEEISAGGEKDEGDLWDWAAGDAIGIDEDCAAAVLNIESMLIVDGTGVSCGWEASAAEQSSGDTLLLALPPPPPKTTPLSLLPASSARSTLTSGAVVGE